MALSDSDSALTVAEGEVDCAPSIAELVWETELLNFINQFLFTNTCKYPHVAISHHLLTRSNRSRGIWRSAASSITRNFSSDCESIDTQGAKIGRTIAKSRREGAMRLVQSTPDLEGIPFRSADMDSRDMKCNLDIERGATDLESTRVVHAPGREREALSTNTTVPQARTSSQSTGYLKHQIEHQQKIDSHLNRGDFSPQAEQCTRLYCSSTEEQPIELFPPVCGLNIDPEVERQATARCTQVSSINTDRKDQLSETVSASFAKETTKPSGKKPPLPPRPNTAHPSSSQTNQVRGPKRPRIENRNAKRRKSATSGFSTLSLLALIVTLCFVIIIVVQGFLGNSNVGGNNSTAQVGPGAQRTFLTVPGERPTLSPHQ